MESVTRIAQKFFDDYAWNEDRTPRFNGDTYSVITGIGWRHMTLVDVENPTMLRVLDQSFCKENAFEAFKDTLFPRGSVAVVTNEDLHFLMRECQEAFFKNDAGAVLKVVKDFVNRASVC